MELHLDFETYSDLNLKKVGVDRYSRHPSTEVLLCSWALDDGPMHLWDNAAGEPFPVDLIDAMEDDDTVLVAFNAAFERRFVQHILGISIPIKRWRCAMVYAYAFGFSGGLDTVASQMGLPEGKMAGGKSLIHRFCKPAPSNHIVRRYTHENDPVNWEKFRAYCIQDTRTARKVWQSLNKVTPYAVEWGHYEMDQRINDRGLPVDVALVNHAMCASREAKEHLVSKLRKATTMVNPKSRPQFMEWQMSRGLGLRDATKNTLIEARDNLIGAGDFELAEILDWKIQLGMTSTSKWQAILDVVVGDRVRDAFQFLGAGRTGRWAGRKLQPQNLPRPTIANVYQAADILMMGEYRDVAMLYDNPMEVMSSLVRSSITASPGKTLVVSDLSGIETRGAGWVCEDDEINKVYLNDGDIYRDFGSYLFNVPQDSISKQQRTFVKPIVLGCQYLLGAKGLQIYAAPYGVDLTRKQARKAVTAYRERYQGVGRFWQEAERAYFEATEGGTATVGPRGCIFMSQVGPFLKVRLPTGRALFYFKPKIERRTLRWEDDDGNIQETEKDMFTFMGRKQSFPWRRIAAHAGHMLENIVQALSRDVLMSGIIRAEAAGLNVVGHVHDEIICEEDDGLFSALTLLNDCMSRPLKWAPGLKLASEGYTARRYRKG